MGAQVRGMAEWLEVLRTLPERAPGKYKPVMSKAGFNMKDDWIAQWEGMPHSHIPHLIRDVGYDTSSSKFTYSVEVGVKPGRRQSRLASFIEYGTLTSGPHPAGVPALEREVPRTADWAERVTAELLE